MSSATSQETLVSTNAARDGLGRRIGSYNYLSPRPYGSADLKNKKTWSAVRFRGNFQDGIKDKTLPNVSASTSSANSISINCFSNIPTKSTTVGDPPAKTSLKTAPWRATKSRPSSDNGASRASVRPNAAVPLKKAADSDCAKEAKQDIRNASPPQNGIKNKKSDIHETGKAHLFNSISKRQIGRRTSPKTNSDGRESSYSERIREQRSLDRTKKGQDQADANRTQRCASSPSHSRVETPKVKQSDSARNILYNVTEAQNSSSTGGQLKQQLEINQKVKSEMDKSLCLPKNPDDATGSGKQTDKQKAASTPHRRSLTGMAEAWLEEAEKTKSAGRERPVWTRDKISPLHSQIQKTKSFYNEIASHQRQSSSFTVPLMTNKDVQDKLEKKNQTNVQFTVQSGHPTLSEDRLQKKREQPKPQKGPEQSKPQIGREQSRPQKELEQSRSQKGPEQSKPQIGREQSRSQKGPERSKPQIVREQSQPQKGGPERHHLRRKLEQPQPKKIPDLPTPKQEQKSAVHLSRQTTIPVRGSSSKAVSSETCETTATTPDLRNTQTPQKQVVDGTQKSVKVVECSSGIKQNWVEKSLPNGRLKLESATLAISRRSPVLKYSTTAVVPASAVISGNSETGGKDTNETTSFVESSLNKNVVTKAIVPITPESPIPGNSVTADVTVYIPRRRFAKAVQENEADTSATVTATITTTDITDTDITNNFPPVSVNIGASERTAKNNSVEGNISYASVHCGREDRVTGGGVMEDGHILPPIPSSFQPSMSVTPDPWKSQSLPCFYSRPTSPPQSFKEAFALSYSPVSKANVAACKKEPVVSTSLACIVPSSDTHIVSSLAAPAVSPCVSQAVSSIRNINGDGLNDEKKSRRFLGALFRRKKRDGKSSSSESDSDDHRRMKFFAKRGKKREPKEPPRTEPQGHVVNTNQASRYFVTADTGRMIQISSTGSLGRECNFNRSIQEIGIPQLITQQTNLGRPGVSLSHDSLAPSASLNSESAYGSINSSMRSSHLGRSSSSDTLNRKEKKEALKTRVERLRDRHYGSSSDEDLASMTSSQFGSEKSLNKSDSLTSKTRSSRTERYLRRKSHELETLKVETEKDRRNREAVQARILEIQKLQKMQKDMKDQKINTPKCTNHGPNLVMPQILFSSPSQNVAGLHMNLYPQLLLTQNSTAAALDPFHNSKKSFQAFSNGSIQNQRSLSYESNINKASSFPSNYFNRAGIISTAGDDLVPPVPPPRDQRHLLSPCELNRPSSYSFENLSQDPLRAPHNINGVPVPYRSPSLKGFSPGPGRPPPPRSPAVPKVNGLMQQPHQTPHCQGAASELLLASYSVPSKVHGSSVSSDVTARLNDCSNSTNSYQFAINSHLCPSDLRTANERSSQLSKNITVLNVPPSPSSDYSSYMSDNSVRLPQGPPVPLLAEPKARQMTSLMVKKIQTSDSSVASNPRVNHQLRNNENVSVSLNSGQFDDASPPMQKPNDNRINDSDSSHSSSKDTNKNSAQVSLAVVVEKSGSIEDEQFLGAAVPRKKPEPPKRGSSSLTKTSRELVKKHLEIMKEFENDNQENRTERKKRYEELIRREKERLQKNKCANFEEAVRELEDIYKSLNLNSDDFMERAEEREAQHEKQGCLNDSSDFNSDGRPAVTQCRRSHTPDKTTDDLHYRRIQLLNRSQSDKKKPLQITGSYMLVSPVHVPPMPFDLKLEEETKGMEPDVTYDDVTYRNIQRANSIKIIDPQPPFGIPLDPVKQPSVSDYMNPSDEKTSSWEPDLVKDDMAFRNLRRDNNLSSRSLNTSELDEILSEAGESPLLNKRMLRSASADRVVATCPLTFKKAESQTPRRVKQQQKARRSGRFIDSFKEALTDSESSPSLKWRRNPSWIERANLTDNKWENLSTSTETLTDLSSIKALSQPDIRQAIIRESRGPTGGPNDPFAPLSNFVTPLEVPLSTVPLLVRVQTIHNVPSSPVRMGTKPYRPLDSIFNTKPKPFYLTNQLPKKESLPTQSPVDIGKLDYLISTLSSIEGQDKKMHCKDDFVKSDLKSESGRESAKANVNTSNSTRSEGNNNLKNRCSSLESSFLSPSPTRAPSVELNVANLCFASPSTVERVMVPHTHEEALQALEASMCTDKVEAMVVSSREVQNRDLRARSVPSFSIHALNLPNTQKLAASIDLPSPVPYSRPSAIPQTTESVSFTSSSLLSPVTAVPSITSFTDRPSEENSGVKNFSKEEEDLPSSPSSSRSSSLPPTFRATIVRGNPRELLPVGEEGVCVTPSLSEGETISDLERSDDDPSASTSSGEEPRRCLIPFDTASLTNNEDGWYCYCVACFTILLCLLHASGLQIMTAFGLILAVASVLVTFAT